MAGSLEVRHNGPGADSRRGRSEIGAIDPSALLVGLEHDDEVRLRAAELIALVRAKLPAGIGEGAFNDFDVVLAEARVLASARALGGAA